MDIEVTDELITLQRDQWNGKKAKISNFPDLLDEVMKYTWTYTEGNHPYLNSSKLKVSLHKFVLQYLYGKEKLDEMLGESNIIEHLDNDGLNCTYDNLHILSADLNKAKVFTYCEYRYNFKYSKQKRSTINEFYELLKKPGMANLISAK